MLNDGSFYGARLLQRGLLTGIHHTLTTYVVPLGGIFRFVDLNVAGI